MITCFVGVGQLQQFSDG